MSGVVLAAIAMALGVAGCAGQAPEPAARLMRPVELALTGDANALRTWAEAGDFDAQYALFLRLDRGLGGATPDPAEAERWRRAALAQRGVTPITQYIPAFRGAPSRVNIINLPRYGMSRAQALLVDRCLAGLSAGTAQPPCGDAETTARLQRLAVALPYGVAE